MYGRPKEALEPIEKAYELAKSKGLSNHMNVVTQLANVRFKNRCLDNAKRFARKAWH